ncbi:hypothetical protein BRADI_1g44806v3 [Brachypodium distachyon]|uniref:Uncharacterized protein n=1 Tax=Brachypodium distachyon TaxID=15368 RepID=A0A2K2DPE4_BRADI|nr:hypothetical protein BRADI_1g44806v3 [Brachypodium distachyon]
MFALELHPLDVADHIRIQRFFHPVTFQIKWFQCARRSKEHACRSSVPQPKGSPEYLPHATTYPILSSSQLHRVDFSNCSSCIHGKKYSFCWLGGAYKVYLLHLGLNTFQHI